MDPGGGKRRKLAGLANDFAPDIVVLLYLLGAGISSIPVKGFEFSKACMVDLKIGKEACDDIVFHSKVQGHEEDYSKVEKLFTSIEVWMEVVRNAVPASIILFTGAFSDKTGRRKFFILLPIFFEILSYLGLLIVEYDFNGSGLVTVGFIRCLPGFSGGTSVLLMAVFSHIGDVTDEKSRTSRIGRLTVVVLACTPLAYLVTPLVVVQGKWYPAILSSLALFVIAAASGIFLIKDNDPKPLPERPVIAFFKPGGILEAFKLICKKRPNNMKKVVVSVTLINVLSTAAASGESKVVYQYLKRTFSLDDRTMSFYFTFSIVVLFVGTALMVYVFIKLYHLEDYKVGLVGNINKIIVNAGYAFVKTPTALYMVTFFDTFTGCTSIATRSIASKAVESEELGKLFSVFGFADLATPPIYAIVYGYFYTYTRETFTGAFFILSYLFIVPIAAFFIFTNKIQQMVKDDPESNLTEAQETTESQPNNEAIDAAVQGTNNDSFELTEPPEKNISDIRL